MKNSFAILILFLEFCAVAQTPQFNVKGTDSSLVRMSQLHVNVKIIGTIAYTTAEMHFTNSASGQMEGELIFPLPEGVSVSRYAIDINGKMREAVPINKNKGQQVFEAIEHRRVDPGLLEKVEGNSFRTRIYPIIANKERIVIIGYQQELGTFDDTNLAYQLQSSYAKMLDVFELTVLVFGTANAPSITTNNGVLEIENLSNSYQTIIKKENYMPAEKVLVKIPILKETPSVLVQNKNGDNFFYASTYIDGVRKQKKQPNSIGLIWDVSLGCKKRNLSKEIQLLDAYFKAFNNTKVTLYFLGYTFDEKETFTIINGNWNDLKNKLQNTIYDGGSRFSNLKLPQHDEFLFFTDGLSSLSEKLPPKTTKPIYTISSTAAADFDFLNYTALQTGGSFINLNEILVNDAVAKMQYQVLHFLGIKNNLLITEVYPMVGTPVLGNFSLTGISLQNDQQVTLLFGYDDAIVIEKTINISINNATEIDIEKLWAQKKIANLNYQYQKNADEIELMGKKYGIVTNNTSLIVLESLNDYLQYDIIPPAELRVDFDRIKKQQTEAIFAQKQNNWQNVLSYFNQLKTWWKKDIKIIKPIKVTTKTSKVRYVAPQIVRVQHTATGIAINDAPVSDKKADFEENVKVDKSEEAVETGVAQDIREKDATTSSQITSAKEQEKLAHTDVTNVLSGKILGLNISKNNDMQTEVQQDSANTVVEVTTWNPNRTYLKALKAASVDKKYELYLQLREKEIANPSFYFDVANYFYQINDKPKAYLILSSIADLGLENHQLYKSLTYLLRQWKLYDDALYTAKQVVKWRTQEPQAHRDLALTYEDNNQFQAAFDELIVALETNYYREMSGQYEGVEDVILMDINRMVFDHKDIKTNKIDKKYLSKMPVAVRIILNWNQMDTDIDLHIIEPNGEECYYGHRDTDAGARFSKDFTQGYGPEQYLLRNAIKGKYIIKTNYFGETTLTQNGPATVMVEIYTTKNGKTTRKLQTIQLGTIKENQNLAQITIL